MSHLDVKILEATVPTVNSGRLIKMYDVLLAGAEAHACSVLH